MLQNDPAGLQSILDAAHDQISTMSLRIAAQNQQLLQQQEQIRAIMRCANAALCSNDPQWVQFMLQDIQRKCQS